MFDNMNAVDVNDSGEKIAQAILRLSDQERMSHGEAILNGGVDDVCQTCNKVSLAHDFVPECSKEGCWWRKSPMQRFGLRSA